MLLIFWLSCALLIYIYAGYPALMWLRAMRCPQALRFWRARPTVTVIVVAHNEGRRIETRLANLLSLDYAPEHLQIILASDGSTDDTVERARRFEAHGVVVRAFDCRRGKPAVLNDVVPGARGEIVLLADARQTFDRGALRALVRDFADPTVGAVSGELVLMRSAAAAAAGDGVGCYWRYEKLIRQSESRVDSTIGATGAIYAIRHGLFQPIPNDTILDDVLIPMMVVRRGYRVLFDSDARAYDTVATSARVEFRRKVRTISGNFQLLLRERWLLNPYQNRLWFEILSHKASRLLAPLLHATAYAANLALASEPAWLACLLAQTTFYAVAFAGFTLRHDKKRSPLVSVPCAICLLCWATIVGFVRYLNGAQTVTWDRASTSMQ